MIRRSMYAIAALVALTLPACGRNPDPARMADAAVADTAVCVVAPTESNGLRQVPAKREVGTQRLFVVEGDRNIPFEERYPVSLLAGYAGSEPWFTSGDPVEFRSRRYVRTGQMRRVPEEQLTRVGDYRGVLVFAPAGEGSNPAALYLPAQPGCVFQPYVRADLMP